jgi:isopenicillin N synthase-like dioxygenase
MKLNEITAFLTNASVKGAEDAFETLACSKKSFSKSEAYKLYGRSTVDRWLTEGLIQISNKKIDRQKLEAIAAKSNRISYLPVADRKGQHC